MNEPESTSPWTAVLMYLVLLCLAVCGISVAGRMVLGWQPMSAFQPFFQASQAALLLAGLGLLQGLYGLFRKNSVHISRGGLTLILGLTPLLIAVITVGLSGFKAPMIHDISTDLVTPPQFVDVVPLRSPDDNSLEHGGAEIASMQQSAFPDLQSIHTSMPVEESMTRALNIVEQLGWELIATNAALGTIEAFETTQIFGFIDDVVIRIRSTPQGSQVDLRSISRVGLGDLGANAARISQFSTLFSERE